MTEKIERNNYDIDKETVVAIVTAQVLNNDNASICERSSSSTMFIITNYTSSIAIMIFDKLSEYS